MLACYTVVKLEARNRSNRLQIQLEALCNGADYVLARSGVELIEHITQPTTFLHAGYKPLELTLPQKTFLQQDKRAASSDEREPTNRAMRSSNQGKKGKLRDPSAQVRD